MSKLSTPIIPKIDAFDPADDKLIEFLYGDNQIVKNRAIVTDNDTYVTVYDSEQSRMRLDHLFPKGTFTAGKSYQIKIKVYDAYGNESDFSNPVLFYCYTKPTFKLSNITAEEIIRTSSIELRLSYNQPQGEQLKEYQFQLYDYNKTLVTSSGNKYDSSMSHTFYQLKNENRYYARAIGLTTHDMEVDTGFIPFVVQYVTISTKILLQVKNQASEGRISLESGIIDIEYVTDNDNYTIENGELTIGKDNTLTYYKGFTITDEFQVFLRARRLPLNKEFFRMKNVNTGDVVSLQIMDFSGKYYGVLNVPYGNNMGTYNIYTELPVNVQNFRETYCIYDIEYKKGWFDLKIYQ